MRKKIKLKPFKVKYDKQVKMWVAQDVNTGYASQEETREKAIENLIDALRLVILTYQDIKDCKPKVSREDLNFLLSLINEDYFQLHGSVGMKQFEQKYEQHIIEFLKEAGVEVED